MRAFILVSLALVLGTGLLVACNSSENLLAQSNRKTVQPPTSPQPASPNPADSARRIDVEELHKLWEKDEVLIIDTRSELDFKNSHIKNAISMPFGTVQDHIEELPRNKMIVAYCT